MALISGTRRSDTLNGTNSADTINGAGGADILNGNGGNDSLAGGDGNDTLTGGLGDDTLTGGAGTDRFKFAAGDGRDTIKDLVAGETVEISGYGAAQSIIQSGSNVFVTLSNSDQITFQNATVASVQAALKFEGGGSGGGGGGNPLPDYAITESFPVGSTTSLTQTEIDVAALTGGGFVAVWTTETESGSFEVKAQLFDNNGRPAGSEYTVNLSASAMQPSVTSMPSGGFVVTWMDFRPNPDDAAGDVFAQMFNASGEPLGGDFAVNSTAVGSQLQPEITTLANGGFVITWTDRYDDIRAQVYAADGSKVGAELIVNDSTGQYPMLPTVAALAGGGFVIGWFDLFADTETVGAFTTVSAGSRAQVFDASGNKVGGAFALNSFKAGYQQNPTLAALPNGGFVAAYADTEWPNGTTTGHGGIWIQLFDALGNKVGVEIRASSLSPADQTAPVIQVVGDTGFLVVWKDGNAAPDSDPGDLRGQWFDFSGNKIGAEVSFGADSAEVYRQAAFDSLSNGAIVLGWGDLPTPDNEDVHARILVPIKKGTSAGDTMAGTADRDVIDGGAGDDNISGGGESDWLRGGDGNDTLIGGDGEDRLDGGAGNDSLAGGQGSDLLDGGAGSDAMSGGDGDDVYVVDSAGDGVAEVAGEGIDEIVAGVSYALAAGAEIEKLTASASGSINLTGNDFGQTLMGNDLNNLLTGLGGADTLIGGDGADTLAGGQGDDLLIGGAGFDVFKFASGDGSDTIGDLAASETIQVSGYASAQSVIQDGASVLVTLSATDTLTILNSDVATVQAALQFSGGDGGGGDPSDPTGPITGTSYPDTLTGSDGGDTIEGLGGSDKLYGLGGNDLLNGGAGADTIDGGAGNDRIDGGGGNDVLTGGAGSDIFLFGPGAGSDRISDFESGIDKIDFSLLGVSSSDITITSYRGTVYVSVDYGRSDFMITLGGAASIAPSDFIFA